MSLFASDVPGLIENVASFRRDAGPQDVYCMPEIPQKRRLTDVGFLITMAVCVAAQLGLMTYALVYSDIRRFTNGYDYCGNICGVENVAVEGVNCSGANMIDKPYLTKQDDLMTCVTKDVCDTKYTHRCDGSGDYNLFEEMVIVTNDESTSLLILCFLGLALSLVSIILFRYYTRVFVWVMITGFLVLLVAICIFLWIFTTTIAAVFFTIITVIFAVFFWALIPWVKLIMRFYIEAVRIVFAMPILLLEPLLTFLASFIVLALFAYTFLLMMTSGTLQKIDYDQYYYYYDRRLYDYQAGPATIVAYSISILMMVWLLLYVLACQQIVIAGAVTAYYFAKDKLTLASPIYNSFYNLVRFHLGSVAYGTLLNTIIRIIQVLLTALSTTRNGAAFVRCCLRPLLNLLKYLTSMGYIELAMHGQDLCRSCRRGFDLIIYNYLSAVALNSVGNFVFFMAKFTVAIITVLVGIALKASSIIVIFGAIVSLVCVHCFFVVFEVAVDTIFLCYCEDQIINDGNDKPYCTNAELYSYIQVAQQTCQKNLNKQ